MPALPRIPWPGLLCAAAALCCTGPRATARAATCACLPAPCDSTATELRAGANGAGTIAHLGAALTAAGDLNGDGAPDFCVGGPDAGTPRTGEAWIYFGGHRDLASPDLVLKGTKDGESFGFSVAGVGDLNGDGYDDLAVGAPTYSLAGLNVGRVLIYLGGPDMDAVPDQIFVGDSQITPLIGTALSAIGDWDGDGLADFAASSVLLVTGQTHDQVEVYLGRSDVTRMPRFLLTPEARTNRFGLAMAPVGDWDGDGLDDLAVASPFGTGKVEVFGWPGRILFTVESGAADDGFGSGVALLARQPVAENLLAVSAPAVNAGGGRTGVVRLIGRDGVVRGTLTGSAGLPLGKAVDASADFDGDGIRDLLAGAPGVGFQFGEVWIWSGGCIESCGCTLTRVRSPRFGIGFGTALAFVPGADGPLPDVLVGAPEYTVGAARVGRFEVYRARRPRFTPAAPGRTFYAGERDTLRWSGADLVDIALSLDGGTTWSTVATSAGGSVEHAFAATVPPHEALRARWRVAWSGRVARPAVEDLSPFFRIARRVPEGRVARRHVEIARGAAAGEREGAVVGWMADVDGDGLSETVIAAPEAGRGRGRVTLRCSGGAVRAWIGESPGDRFGAAIAATHDLDGDGVADLAVGAPGRASGAGAVYLIGGGAAAPPRRVIEGYAGGEETGAALCVIAPRGGGAALIVGAPGAAAAAGAVRVHPAPVAAGQVAQATLAGAAPGDRFGTALAAAGDLDADGRADLAVGAPLAGRRIEGAGTVSLYAFPSPAAAPWLVLTGEARFEAFGSALAGGADLDADGFDDLVIGSPGRSGPLVDAGRVTVLPGGPRLDPAGALRIDGPGAGARLGTAVAIAGDVNGDGIADLAAGAPFAGPADAGRVQIHHGLPRMNGVPDVVLSGGPGDRAGFAIAAASDPAQPGIHDLIVGAPYANTAGPDAGRAERIDAERYFLLQPNGGETWQAGTMQKVEWLGDEPADVQISLDGGGSWTTIAGAEVRTHVYVRVPAEATDHARVRVVAAGGARIGWDDSDRDFRIRTAVRLVRFEARAEPDGVHLEWETDPAPGSEGIRGCRLVRIAPDGAETPLQPSAQVTAERTWLDADAVPGARYRLIALDATGRWVELGERPTPGPGALSVGPLPYRGVGPLALALVAPVEATARTPGDFEVRLFDAAGREARTLAHGALETRTGVVRLEWDGRLDDGSRAAPGVYFLRAAAPSARFWLTRRLVVLR